MIYFDVTKSGAVRHRSGLARLGERLREELKDHNRGLGRKPTVRICAVSCLDLCDYGPNIVVHPSGRVYGSVDHEKARAIYDAECGDGPERPDLELER